MMSFFIDLCVLHFVHLDRTVDCKQNTLPVFKIGITNWPDPEMCIDNDLQRAGLEIRPVTSKRTAAISDDGRTRRTNLTFDVMQQLWELTNVCVFEFQCLVHLADLDP